MPVDPNAQPPGILSIPDPNSPFPGPSQVKHMPMERTLAPGQPDPQALPPAGFGNLSPETQNATAIPPELPTFDNSAAIQQIGEEALGAKLKKPGVIDRIRNKPGGSEALLAFGAAMLSAPNFAQGMGQGITAYSAALRQGKLDAKPKVDSIAGGAYDRVTDADGNVTYQETPGAQFLKDKYTAPIEGRKDVAKLTQEGQNYRIELTEKGKNERQGYELTNKMDIADLMSNTQLDIAEMRTKASEAVAKIAAEAKGGRPISPGITKQVTELVQVRDSLGNALTTIAPVMENIRTGKLTFDFASNARHKIALGTGVGGNEQTQMYAEYNQQLEMLRNALLLANKGVQTDGDADRAMNELIAGKGDTRSIQANLNVVYRSLRMRMGQANGRVLDIADQSPGVVISHSAAGTYNHQTAPAKGGTTSSGTKWRVVP